MDLRKLFCCVTHFACPPQGGPNRTGRGMPFCAVLDYRWSQDAAARGTFGSLLDDVQLLNRAFLCFYCWCFGCGFTDCHDPWISSLTRCCCIRNHCFTRSSCPSDGDCAFHHEKCCCCVA